MIKNWLALAEYDLGTARALMEPFCILWEDYLHCEPTSILAEIIRTSIEVASVPENDDREEMNRGSDSR
ncbi:MAG: hypothetical protein ACYC9O_02605 [Candidatus Latescibacterota bacterium]